MERSPSPCVWPPCQHAAPASEQLWGASSAERTTGPCASSSWSQRGPSARRPAAGRLWNRSKSAPAALERGTHGARCHGAHCHGARCHARTSVLGERRSLPLVFGHVGQLLLASGLGDADRHLVPVQRRVDVHVEGGVAHTLHSIQKDRHLQHSNSLNACIPLLALRNVRRSTYKDSGLLIIN